MDHFHAWPILIASVYDKAWYAHQDHTPAKNQERTHDKSVATGQHAQTEQLFSADTVLFSYSKFIFYFLYTESGKHRDNALTLPRALAE